jgi:hypothetical protein
MNKYKNSGFIKAIIVIIIGIIILSLLNVNLRSVFNNKLVRDNFNFVWTNLKTLWGNYLRNPALYAYNVFYDYIWLTFIETMERLKAGRQPDFIENASFPRFR